MVGPMLSQLSRFAWRAVVVIVTVAATVTANPSTAGAAVTAPADGYGFGAGASPVYQSFGDTTREVDAVGKTGASWLRVLVDWNSIEGTQGQYNWGYLDNVVNAARANNLRVLAVVAYTPLWARPQGPGQLFWTVPPVDAGQFARFSADVAKRYGNRIAAYEIWNEPNLPLFFGFVDRKAERYTEILKAAYPAIKSVAPGATVVAAGMSPLPGDDAPPAFYAQMYAAGAGGSFDAGAAHPYVFPGGIGADPLNSWSDVARVHDVMVANGDGAKKIWMTELGAPNGTSPDSVSPEVQAQQITDVLAASAATGYSGPAFIYSIRDVNSADPGNRESNFGALLTSDWQPKYTAGVLARQ
jgi:polysaccharide biosynthesis protein PslG